MDHRKSILKNCKKYDTIIRDGQASEFSLDVSHKKYDNHTRKKVQRSINTSIFIEILLNICQDNSSELKLLSK